MSKPWSPTTLLRELGPDLWEMRHPAMPHARFGTIRRVEGPQPFRHAWFKVETAAGASLGMTLDVEVAAALLYQKGQPPGAQEKPTPGYPPFRPLDTPRAT